MQTVLIIIQLIVSVALIIVVLLQRSEGGALGMGGGGSGMGGLFSPRGAADTLTRTTAILAVLFFSICLGLTILGLHSKPRDSIFTQTSGQTAPAAGGTVPAPKPAPAKPEAPKVPAPR